MFSGKEFVVFGVSIGFGLSYMIFKLSYEIAKNMANQDIAAIRDFMLGYHALIFLLYAVLLLIHVLMLLVSRRFVKNPVKENFDRNDWFIRASGTLWLFVAISLIMALFDGLHFLEMWVSQPYQALEFSNFFYWVYRVYSDPIPELSQIAVLWQLPMIIFEILFCLFAYKRYYEAKKLFTNLFPNVARDGIYNAFSSLRKKEDTVHIKPPEDNLGIYGVDDADEAAKNGDGISPLYKPVGNNTLYSVDPKPKEKNILRTQAEIDSEEGWFSESGGTAPNIKPVTEANGNRITMPSADEAGQELIPTEFDFSKMKLAPSKNTDTAQRDEVNTQSCPLCGYLNAEGRGECEFCGAELRRTIDNV